MKPKHFSGNSLIIFQALIGIVTSLECITCTWNPMNTTDDCVSKPFDQPTEQCSAASDNNNHVSACETKATFKTVGKSFYLESVTRQCALKHYYCNKICKPLERGVCNLCCNEENNCNNFPLTSNALPISMYYNATSTASQTPKTARASFSLLVELIIPIVLFLF